MNLQKLKEISLGLKVKSILPLIIDYISDFIIVLSEEGKIQYANNSLLNALGYSFEEIKGKDFLVLLHEKDLERTNKAFSRSKNEGVIKDFKNRYVKKDGSILCLNWRQSFTLEGVTIGVSEKSI